MTTNNEQSNGSVREQVLEQIEQGQAHMRPKWHFVLERALFALGTLIVALLLLYAVSFVLFVSYRSGAWFLPGFGVRGTWALLLSLPWILILASICFVVLLEVLVRHFAFVYRQPLLYSLAGILLLVVLISALVVRARVHEGLFIRARQGKLPVAGGLYHTYRSPHGKGVHPGIVVRLNGNGFAMQNREDEILLVIITPQTQLIPDTMIDEDDNVLVLGKRQDGTIYALGIRKVEDNQWFLPNEICGAHGCSR